MPQLPQARRRPLRRDELGVLLPAHASTACSSTSRRTIPRHRRVATTRWSASRESSTTSASAANSSRRRSTTAAGGRSRTHATLVLAGRLKPLGQLADLLRRQRLRGRLSVRRHEARPCRGAVSMFEALMPSLFVPEEKWAPHSWGDEPSSDGPGPDPPRAQGGRLWRPRVLAREQARGRVWRVGRRRRLGCTRMGCRPTRTRRSSITASRAAPAPPRRIRRRRTTRTASSPLTPHSWPCATRRRDGGQPRPLVRDFPGLYAKWGFRDSVNVQTKRVSEAYLSLDQGMIMALLGNALGRRRPATRFATTTRAGARPVIGIERFSTAP